MSVTYSGGLSFTGSSTLYCQQSPVAFNVSSISSYALQGIGYDSANNHWMVSGGNGSTYYSQNGGAWTSKTAATAVQLNAIAFNGSRWFAVGGANTGRYSSTTATDFSWNWTTSYPMLGTSTNSNKFSSDVDALGSTFVVVGVDQTTSYPYRNVYYSSNGSSWTQNTSVSGLSLRKVRVIGATIWYMGVGLRSALAANGPATSRITPSSLNDIAYSGTKYVTVGDDGQWYTSTDGTTFTSQTPFTATTLQSIDYGAGKFIAVGTNASMFWSADGTTWSQLTVPTLTTQTINKIRFNNNKWVFVADGGYIGTASV